MELKYHTDISGIVACPPTVAAPRDQHAFRFIHDEIHDERNFVVPAKLNPKRKFPGHEEQCAAYALSFFSSKDAAFAKFLKLVKSNPNIKKLLGTQLAEGDLKKQDGRSTPISKSGHFDLFESKDSSLAGRFRIVATLP